MGGYGAADPLLTVRIALMTVKRHHLCTVDSLYKHLPGPAAHLLIMSVDAGGETWRE